MIKRETVINEIVKKGWDILVENLGITDATRFIVSFERGKGDSVQKINKFWGKIITNRADGAFVRISAPVLNNDVDETIEYEKEFASQLLELFPQCWPIEENAT